MQEDQANDRIVSMLLRAGIAPIYRGVRFDTIDRNRHPSAVEVAQSYAYAGTAGNKPWLMFSGNIGNGKSWMAHATLDAYVRHHKGAKSAYVWDSFVDLHKIKYSRDKAPFRERLLELVDYDFLLVDAIGYGAIDETNGPWLKGLFDALIERKRHVVIVANWNRVSTEAAPENMSEFDGRTTQPLNLIPAIRTHLSQYCHEILFTGPDYRRI